MFLKVAIVRSGSDVPHGAVFPIARSEVIIGRDPSADIVLNDARVSRRHARIQLRADGLWLQNLSQFRTYVNRVVVDGERALSPEDWLQVGGVLMQLLGDVDATAQDAGPMTVDDVGRASSPARLQPDAALVLDIVARRAWLAGREARLRPVAFTVLEVLARSGGEWVTRERLAAAVWPDGLGDWSYLKKYLSQLRADLRGALDGDDAVIDRVRAAIQRGEDGYSDLGGLDAASPRELLVELVKARRKVGYRLHLSAADVCVAGA